VAGGDRGVCRRWEGGEWWEGVMHQLISPAPEEGDLHGDDAELSLDQIWPQLRSLGDSVTSAVR
jgi:hypothetical protein